ncbi:MAG: DUF1684 domain-containing protein [Melioribacteraceae bacterium]|nr:DUF1684 domain-containing protein [Melioribacteraceae bacterium]
MKHDRLILFLLISLLLFNCTPKLQEKGSPNYISGIKEWHKKRVENLKKDNGWLNLVGLYWLNQGENKFGSDKSNDVIFPADKAPLFMGSFLLQDSIVTIKINDSVEVLLENCEQVTEMELKHDQQKGTTILDHGSLRWNLIKRGNRFGIRLRDLDAELVKNFPGIETFPVNDNWRIEAEFEEYNPQREIEIPTVIGTIEKEKSPGAIVFEMEGTEYRLDVTDAGKSYFVIFADLTSGIETYGAGRFLSVDKADSTGKIFIDFNKAYNPPCVFTKYATCPLPPKQNHIKLEITAGEMNFGEGH